MNLVNPNDPILKQVLEPFVFDGSVDAWKLVSDLVEIMTEKKGIGLAANQVGLNHRVFVITGKPPIAMFNPRIVDVSTETIVLEEGCLTYPGLFIKVKRPIHVRVRYQDADGETHTEKLTGMSARVVQHEVGHLNGERFYDKANRFHRDQGFKKRK